jgi:hypothetical protein
VHSGERRGWGLVVSTRYDVACITIHCAILRLKIYRAYTPVFVSSFLCGFIPHKLVEPLEYFVVPFQAIAMIQHPGEHQQVQKLEFGATQTSGFRWGI